MELKTQALRHGAAARREEGTLMEVAPDVACISLSIVNACLVGTPGTGPWVLVDAGLRTSARTIREEAQARFGERRRPEAIILTHGHFDHVGALRQLADEWDVPVYAHVLELPYLTGRSSYPPPDPTVGGGAMAWMSWMYPRRPLDLGRRVHPLPEDRSVPGMPGWTWIHTPGHSPGHISLFRDSDRLLIVGDAFVTTRQESMLCAVMQPEEVNGPPAYFTPDWENARESVRVLAALEPHSAVTGHGHPLSGEPLKSGLARLARDFDQVARPSRGRYLHQPARADLTGVVCVPPSAVDPQLVLTGAFAVGVLAGIVATGVRSSRKRGGS